MLLNNIYIEGAVPRFPRIPRNGRPTIGDSWGGGPSDLINWRRMFFFQKFSHSAMAKFFSVIAIFLCAIVVRFATCGDVVNMVNGDSCSFKNCGKSNIDFESNSYVHFEIPRLQCSDVCKFLVGGCFFLLHSLICDNEKTSCRALRWEAEAADL